MDIAAHALWTAAAALTARKTLKRPISWPWAVAWGVAPDLAVFAVPVAVKVWRLATGAAKSLLPDGTGPRFEWVTGLYNGTHSALIFAVCFGLVWLFLRRPVVEMLGWALHIAIDIPTHSGWFAIQFLWPLWAVRFEGTRWETPWLLGANYAALASVYLLLWIRRDTQLERAAQS